MPLVITRPPDQRIRTTRKLEQLINLAVHTAAFAAFNSGLWVGMGSSQAFSFSSLVDRAMGGRLIGACGLGVGPAPLKQLQSEFSMSLSSAQLNELSQPGRPLYVQVAGWHLFSVMPSYALLAEELAAFGSRACSGGSSGLERLQVLRVAAAIAPLPFDPRANSLTLRRSSNLSVPEPAAGTGDTGAPLRWPRMIVIEVTNSREVVRQRVGRLGERLIGTVVDAEAQVEKALLQELENAFREFGIEARIFSVDGPAMVGRSHVEVPVHVRDQRTVN